MKTTRPSRLVRDQRGSSDQRGSILIVALLFAAAIAVSLGSYLNLATTSSQVSYRSHFLGVAMNAAESGLEQAMWSINKQNAGVSAAWDGWDLASGKTARRTFDLGSVAGGGAVVVKVLVSDRTLASSDPYAIARAIVTPARGAPVEKWVKITLTQRSLFSNGLVAKDTVSFSGNNVYVDSYDSRLGPYDGLLADGSRNRFARGSAGSASVALDSLNIGNADIYGYASVGTSDRSGLKVGTQGKVTGDFDAPGGTIDDSRVATNFTANFDAVQEPATSGFNLGTINADTALPRLDHLATDPKVVTTHPDGSTTTTYYYEASTISLQNKALTILPGYNVALVVSGGVSLGGGSGAIIVNSIATTTDSGTAVESARLDLYVEGNIDIGGNGAGNETVWTRTVLQEVTTGRGNNRETSLQPVEVTSTEVGRPENLMIWGTGGSSQVIKVAGNGKLSAVVYAPNAAIEAKGGGNSGGLYGAFIGKSVKMTGNEGFHYDESLAVLNSGEPLGIGKWDEFVSAADRASVGNLMDF